MLFQKLIGAMTGGSTPSYPITYVGGYTKAIPGIITDVVVPLTSLTGGLSTSPQEGDIVVVFFSTASTAATTTLSINPGFTSFNTLNAADTYDTNLRVAYKCMGSVPDTSFTLSGGTKAITDAGAVVVQVFRNSNQYLVDYVAATTSTSINGGVPNPPLISGLSVANSVVVAGGGGSGTGSAFTSSLTDFRTVSQVDTNSIAVGAGYNQVGSGTSYNPPAFGGGNTAITCSQASLTMVIGPNEYTTGFKSYAVVTGDPVAVELATLFQIKRSNLLIQEGDLLVAFVFLKIAGDVSPSYNDVSSDGWIKHSNSLFTKMVTSSEQEQYRFFVKDPDNDGYNEMGRATIFNFRQFAYDLLNTSSIGVTPTFSGSYVLGFPATTTTATTFSQASFFNENKLVTVTGNEGSGNGVSFTVFGKPDVAIGPTGAVVYIPGEVSTLASIKPKPVGNAVSIIGTASAVDASTYLAVPNHQAGDWLVVVNGRQSATPPALLAGYTDLGTVVGGTTRSARVQYIVSDGTIATITVQYYGSVAVLRGVSSVGQSIFTNSSGSSATVPLPTITGLTTNVNNLILGGNYSGSAADKSASSNYGMLEGFGAAIYGPLASSSLTGVTVTYGSSQVRCGFMIEFLP